MNQPDFRSLADDLREQVHLIQRAVDDMVAASSAAGNQPTRVILWACAGTLHAFYTGIEKAFETIAQSLNGTPPAGPDWHRRLLRSMSVERPTIRPAVIDAQSASLLDEYLAFRHRYRNLYLFDLRWELIRDLLEKAPEVWCHLSGELREFIRYIENLATTT